MSSSFTSQLVQVTFGSTALACVLSSLQTNLLPLTYKFWTFFTKP